MRTRATIASRRVTVDSYRTWVGDSPGLRWMWSVDGQQTRTGFATSAHAIENAQAALGPDVRIVRHTDSVARGGVGAE
jgi:hypothetical protein